MYFSAISVFSVTSHQLLLVAIVVNLIYIYLTRIQFMYDILYRSEDQVVPLIYHTW